jgi:glutamyl-tRNA synthetase
LHNALLDKLVVELKIKPRDAFTPLRIAITGQRVSPPLFESMSALGKEEVLERIDSFLLFRTNALSEKTNLQNKPNEQHFTK